MEHGIGLKVENLLKDGQPRSVEQIAKDLNRSKRQIGVLMSYYRKNSPNKFEVVDKIGCANVFVLSTKSERPISHQPSPEKNLMLLLNPVEKNTFKEHMRLAEYHKLCAEGLLTAARKFS